MKNKNKEGRVKKSANKPSNQHLQIKKKKKNDRKMVIENSSDVQNSNLVMLKKKKITFKNTQCIEKTESPRTIANIDDKVSMENKKKKRKVEKNNEKIDSSKTDEIILPKKVKLDIEKIKKVKKKKTDKRKFKKEKVSEKLVSDQTFSSNVPSHSPQPPTIKEKLKQKSELPRLKLNSSFSWDDQFHLPNKSNDNKDESSSEDSDSEEEKRVEKTRAEIRLEKIAEEKKIYEYEKKRLEGKEELETADDFDRLVLQSPDSSLVWTRYMAYHLECTEIDKARAVAERALNTISFRDEQEKLNIWVAYLNLENMYGISDQLEEIFERAKKCCDFRKIHERMISIYVRSEKYEEAEELYEVLVKKFNSEKQIWLNYVQFCFRNNRLDNGRKLLQRSCKCVEKKEHIEIISKVAQMEIKFGDGERGRTMYENLVMSYPKRLDLWSVYIDMIRILGDLEGTRKLFERVLSLKMNAKRMKFIFKKYLDFENQYGSPEKVAEIKEKALKYVESKGYYDDL